jgi:ATP-binding cassette subfamily B protein
MSAGGGDRGSQPVHRTFLSYLGPYRAAVALLVAGLVVELVFNAAMPLAFKLLIDEAIPERDGRLLWTVLTVMGIAVIAAGAAAIGRDYLYARLGSSVMNDLRLRMYEQLQRLSAGYYTQHQVGDTMARFSTDLGAVRNAVVYAVPETVLGVLGIVFYSVVLLFLEPVLAIVTIVGLPLLLIGPRLLGGPAERESLRVREQEARIASTVQESIAASAVVRAFGLGERQVAAFRKQLDTLYGHTFRFSVMSYLVERTPNVAFLLLQLAILAVGSVMAYRGSLEIGSLVAFNAIVLSLSVAITGLTRIMPLLLEASGGIRRISELLEEPEVAGDATDATPVSGFEQAIEFRDVSFSYEGTTKQLDGVSLTIPKGAKVAFVGSSGSGKSTVLTVLLRFYDPQAGAIMLDGTDTTRITQRSLRSLMGVVFQESLLFDATIGENIRMGRLDATGDDVHAAAAHAELVDVVEALPERYDTAVGERGGRLSGGQRQRVAIARALVRDPAILVLDEATSALDPATEAAIDATIARIAEGRTVVAVSHRLSSIMGYDRIFVMHQGRLVEQGTHAELVKAAGLYHDLWAKQQGVRVSDDGRQARVTGDYLRSVNVFSRLSEEVVADLTSLFVTEHYPEGRVVIYEGDTVADKFYVIARGKVSVTKGGEGGERVHLASRSDGDHFGEVALVRDVPRTATVTTVTPCVLLSLRRDDFLGLLESEPELRREIAQVVAARSATVEV